MFRFHLPSLRVACRRRKSHSKHDSPALQLITDPVGTFSGLNRARWLPKVSATAVVPPASHAVVGRAYSESICSCSQLALVSAPVHFTTLKRPRARGRKQTPKYAAFGLGSCDVYGPSFVKRQSTWEPITRTSIRNLIELSSVLGRGTLTL
jgi:hypothetical protein